MSKGYELKIIFLNCIVLIFICLFTSHYLGKEEEEEEEECNSILGFHDE